MEEQREVAGRMRLGCQSPSPPWKPILVCIPLPFSSFYLSPGHLILSPVYISYLLSCSASHPFCPGCIIALVVTLALRRPEWTSPCSCKPSNLLASAALSSFWLLSHLGLPFPSVPYPASWALFSPFPRLLPVVAVGADTRHGRLQHHNRLHPVRHRPPAPLWGLEPPNSLQPHEDHTTYISLQYSGPEKSP